MATTAAPSTRTALEPRSWRGLALLAGAACVLVLLWQGLRRGDQEALALAAVVVLGGALSATRRPRVGLVLLALVFADSIVFLLPAANANANAQAGVGAMFVPGSVTGLALGGLLGAVMALRTGATADAGRGVALRAGVAVVGFVGAGLSMTWLLTPAPPAGAPAGAVGVEARGVAFHPTALEAAGGKVTVAMRNQDLFWHTFTVRGLGVSMAVPVGALRSTTFDAPPGRYQFVCAIPGHEQAGMRGTLVVR
jgi:plastocyanin